MGRWLQWTADTCLSLGSERASQSGKETLLRRWSQKMGHGWYGLWVMVGFDVAWECRRDGRRLILPCPNRGRLLLVPT